MVAAPVHDAAEIDGTFAELAREPGGGLMIVPDTFTDANHALITTVAAKLGLPAIYGHRYDDALISYGPDLRDVFRRAASYVDRIMRGEKPSELPVQAPTKYELIVDLKKADALGLTIPPSLLASADKLIE
jgi:putative ABC transport system substrate-binding protein